MSKYLVYDVRALEDLKFAKTNMQSDSEETMEYIPGTSVRGAYIYKYISKNKIKDINQGLHREKLLNGGIKFLNAYPKYNAKRSIPFPKAYFAPKELIKTFDTKLKIKSGLDKSLDPGYEKVRQSEFVSFLDGEYFKINIDKRENLHINKMKGNSNNKLFRYEAIKSGQVFQGIIKVDEDVYLEEVKQLLEDEIVYLGGAKGSGYGKCRIENIEVTEKNPEYKEFKTIEAFRDEIYLLVLSDVIFRNNIGEYKTFIDEDFIAQKLKLNDAKLVDSSIEVKMVSNFNNKWNCSTPNINSIKKGSVFKYKFTGKIDIKTLIDFVDNGIGERKLDGFGRFIILDSLEDSYINTIKDLEYKQKNNEIKITKTEKEKLNNIVNMIYKKRLENDISKRVIQIDENIENSQEMEKSQWGNYKGLFTSLIYEESSTGIEKFYRYMDNIKSKRSKSYNEINKVGYENKGLMEFFQEFVKDSTNLKKFNQKSTVSRIVLEDLESNIDEEFLYKYNMKILAELCRYEILKGEE